MNGPSARGLLMHELFRVIEDHHLDGRTSRFELQSELFLNGREDVGVPAGCEVAFEG
jgi:hypothetical protein